MLVPWNSLQTVLILFDPSWFEAYKTAKASFIEISTYETQNHFSPSYVSSILYQSIKKLSALTSETLRTSETLDDVVVFMNISVTSGFEFEGAEFDTTHWSKSLEKAQNCFQWSQDLNCVGGILTNIRKKIYIKLFRQIIKCHKKGHKKVRKGHNSKGH